MSARLTTWLRGGLLASLAVVVCLGQQLPNLPEIPRAPETPIPPGGARLIQVAGDVSVLKGSEPWVLDAGDVVRPKQVILTGADGFAVFQLEDGSTFQVFPNSRVTFRANPGDWRDLLDLWLGHVKIFIQKLGGQPNRNRVFTPTAVISVRGTVFDVLIEDENDTTVVSVEEGAVTVRHRLIGESKSKLVRAGEYIRVYKNIPLAKSRIDKNALAAGILRSAGDVLYGILIHTRTSSPGGSPAPTGGAGPRLPGDTAGGEPPPPPPSGGGGGSPTPENPPAPPAPPPPPGG